MPDPSDLPEHLRARLARGLDAVPEARPLPEQAIYAQARAGRRRPRRRPAMALATGAVAVIGLALVAGLTSSGSANPVSWTGRALSAIRQEGPPAPSAPPAAPASTATARPGPSLQPPPPSPAAWPPPWPNWPPWPGWPGWWDQPPVRPEATPPPAPRLPLFTPRPFPTPFPFPTPPGTSDFGRGGR